MNKYINIRNVLVFALIGLATCIIAFLVLFLETNSNLDLGFALFGIFGIVICACLIRAEQNDN